MHSTGYIYPVHHIVEFAYRITPTGLNYLHRIYPQDIQKYVLWVYPVENFLYILYIVYPVGNLSFTDVVDVKLLEFVDVTLCHS